ncbi:MAG: sulfite exporter TauE/SafE family protein [Saprospirales bacterium]|nr:MAG: sulfite exporter TauE/SafE family protein [Saprospirales bacterium]
MELSLVLLYFLLPLVAFLYASVGHGGASSYLMILALFGFAPEEIRPTALMMNILVSFMAFMAFRQVSTFPTRLFFSLIIFSVPAAYLGGSILVDEDIYRRVLGVLLLLPVFRMLGFFTKVESRGIPLQWWAPPAIGLGIGFVSGLIGIGGGIILSPILLLAGWADIKQTAALSALFIFFNSISGLSGALMQGVNISPELLHLIPIAIIGGALGAFLGSHRFNVSAVKNLLVAVLIIASIKLIFL